MVSGKFLKNYIAEAFKAWLKTPGKKEETPQQRKSFSGRIPKKGEFAGYLISQ